MLVALALATVSGCCEDEGGGGLAVMGPTLTVDGVPTCPAIEMFVSDSSVTNCPPHPGSEQQGCYCNSVAGGDILLRVSLDGFVPFEKVFDDASADGCYTGTHFRYEPLEPAPGAP